MPQPLARLILNTAIPDATNQDQHENCESLLTINLGETRNDYGVSSTVPLVIVHGFRDPLYNLAVQKLKADPDHIQSLTLSWFGLAVPLPFPVSVQVANGSFTAPPALSFDFAVPDVGAMLKQLEDNLEKLLISLIPQPVLQALPNVLNVMAWLGSLGADVLGIFQAIAGLGTAAITEINNLITQLQGMTLSAVIALAGPLVKIAQAIQTGVNNGATTVAASIAQLQIMATWVVSQLQNLTSALITGLLLLPAKMLEIKVQSFVAGLISQFSIDISALTGWVSWISLACKMLDPLALFQQLVNMGGSLVANATALATQMITYTVAQIQASVDPVIHAVYLTWQSLLDTVKPLIDSGKMLEAEIHNLINQIVTWGSSLPGVLSSIVTHWLASFLPLIPQVGLPTTLVQLPPPGTPSPTGSGVLAPAVSWPSWMAPDGIATIPIQQDPSLDALAATAPQGVVAFQSIPGFTYVASIQVATKATTDVGQKTTDLYLTATDRTGAISYKVGRIRLVHDLQTPTQYKGFNTSRANPPGFLGTKSDTFTKVSGQDLYALNTNTLAVDSVQTMLAQTGTLTKGTGVSQEVTDALGNITSISSVSYTTGGVTTTYVLNTDYSLTSSQVTANVVVGGVTVSTLITSWTITWITAGARPPDGVTYTVDYRGPKTVAGTNLLSGTSVDVSSIGIATGETFAVTYQFNPDPSSVEYHNLGLP